MAKQPEDHTTPDMFGPSGQSKAGTITFGRAGAGKPTLQPPQNARVSRFRASRRLFPAADAVCEVCGRRHDGDCEAKGEVNA